MKGFRFLSIILGMMIFFSCARGQTSSKHYKVLDLEDFKMQIQLDSNSLLVDVRTPEEFEAGHIENAINVDFKNSNFRSNVEQLDTSKNLFIYCRSGNRSKKSSSTFLKHGFKKVNDLKGGYSNFQSDSNKTSKQN